MLAHRALVITSAARNNAPAVYNASDFVRDGGLLSYGPDPVDLFRRAATYVDRILRGEKPGDLPEARLIWPGQVCPAATRTSLRRGGAAGFARSAFRFAEFSSGSPSQAAFGGLVCTYSRTECCCYLSSPLPRRHHHRSAGLFFAPPESYRNDVWAICVVAAGGLQQEFSSC